MMCIWLPTYRRTLYVGGAQLYLPYGFKCFLQYLLYLLELIKPSNLLKNFQFRPSNHTYFYNKMPRAVAPPPSGEFQVKLSKPFAGQYKTGRRRRRTKRKKEFHSCANSSFPPVGEPKLTIEVLGEPNRSAVIRQTHYTGNNKSSEKTGDVSSYVVPAFGRNTALLNPPHPSI